MAKKGEILTKHTFLPIIQLRISLSDAEEHLPCMDEAAD